jgi:nitroreductase
MSDFLSLLRGRRSIRRFRPTPVEAEKIDLLREALLRSPSSRGLNPWEFIFVTDPELLRRLARAKAHGSEFLAKAPLAVVIAADPRRCDVWVEDCSIAAIILQLAAHSLGLGSCWAQIRLRAHGDGGMAEGFVRDLLRLPESLTVECIVGIGYPGETKKGHPRESLPWHRLHHPGAGPE